MRPLTAERIVFMVGWLVACAAAIRAVQFYLEGR